METTKDVMQILFWTVGIFATVIAIANNPKHKASAVTFIRHFGGIVIMFVGLIIDSYTGIRWIGLGAFVVASLWLTVEWAFADRQPMKSTIALMSMNWAMVAAMFAIMLGSMAVKKLDAKIDAIIERQEKMVKIENDLVDSYNEEHRDKTKSLEQPNKSDKTDQSKDGQPK